MPLCFGILDPAGRQVGSLRVVSDMATFAWVCDVVVAEDRRGRGLGPWMMDVVASHPRLQGLRRWVLGPVMRTTCTARPGSTRSPGGGRPAPDDPAERGQLWSGWEFRHRSPWHARRQGPELPGAAHAGDASGCPPWRVRPRVHSPGRPREDVRSGPGWWTMHPCASPPRPTTPIRAAAELAAADPAGRSRPSASRTPRTSLSSSWRPSCWS